MVSGTSFVMNTRPKTQMLAYMKNIPEIVYHKYSLITCSISDMDCVHTCEDMINVLKTSGAVPVQFRSCLIVVQSLNHEPGTSSVQ